MQTGHIVGPEAILTRDRFHYRPAPLQALLPRIVLWGIITLTVLLAAFGVWYGMHPPTYSRPHGIHVWGG